MANKHQTLVSGHNPMMGPRMLGHYVCTLKEWPSLQEEYRCFFFVDDILAYLICRGERQQILNRTLYTVRDVVASGIDLNKCDIFLTSQVPELLELMLWLGTTVDAGFCQDAHAESFTGLMSNSQRKQIGLNNHTCITELVYPQLGPPVLTLGLGANAFQGGEEITGYIDIMKNIASEFNRKHGDVLSSPKFVPAKVGFITGTDGRHMMAGNHIAISAPPEDILESCMQIHDYSILVEWYTALDETERAAGLPSTGPVSDEDKKEIADFMISQFERFRAFKISNREVLDITSKGSAAARARLRETLGRIKDSMNISDFTLQRGAAAS